jgi:formylglycine-generating enzyme required for sulfatase activity
MDKISRLVIGAVAGVATTCGCDGGGSAPGTSKHSRGPIIEIDAQPVVMGFSRGLIRKSVPVDAFSIARLPVTIGDYHHCVAAGACPEPPQDACTEWPGAPISGRANYKEKKAPDDVAVTCVGYEGARKYCEWKGGDLPTIEQWMLAARGQAPRLHSWGDDDATCKRHGLANPTGALCSTDGAEIGKVGLHKAGASPFGVEDTLITGGELLRPSENSVYSTCRAQDADGGPSQPTTCMVVSSRPGEIDSLRMLAVPEGHPQKSSVTYGFRCAWGASS